MSEENQFKSFSDIERLESRVVITEKIHGSNAQIIVVAGHPTMGEQVKSVMVNDEPFMIKACSRTQEIFPEKGKDNYGFAQWVYDNAEALVKFLGVGRHYGEWYGSGINSGYGLKEKRFALFNTFRWQPEKDAGKLPDRVDVVPTLYAGPWRDGIVTEVMAQLKEKGSALAPGFMSPEGVVVRWDRNGMMMKKVFEAEESAWQGKVKEKKVDNRPPVDPELVRQYLQPIRLEKLLSRDEQYLINYPNSLGNICRDYILDLVKEQDFDKLEDRVAKTVKGQIFPWVKTMLKEKGYDA